MKKFLDNIAKYSLWVILTISLIAYFMFRILVFDTTIETLATDIYTYVHTTFVIYLHLIVQSASWEMADENGLMSKTYLEADVINNRIIKEINKQKPEFRQFVKDMNEHELKTAQDAFLTGLGKELKELNDKELFHYNKVKGIRHDVYGFNLPLFYETSRDGVIKYNASSKKNSGKSWQRMLKVGTGVLFSFLTLGMNVRLQNFGEALISIFIIISGLIFTALLSYLPRLAILTRYIPHKVKNKYTFYETFTERDNIILEKPLKAIKLDDLLEEDVV